MRVSTSHHFPCVVSAFGVIEQAEARPMLLHTASGKEQWRAEPHFGGAPEETKMPPLL